MFSRTFKMNSSTDHRLVMLCLTYLDKLDHK